MREANPTIRTSYGSRATRSGLSRPRLDDLVGVAVCIIKRRSVVRFWRHMMASLFLLDALTFLIVRGWHGRNLQWSAQSQTTEICIYPIRPVGHMFHLWHWFQRSRHRFCRPRALCADSVRCMFLNPGSQRSLRDELHFVGLRPCWF